jgi:hypothetical protein
VPEPSRTRAVVEPGDLTITSCPPVVIPVIDRRRRNAA